ncbi:MAG: ammonium transporter, partial [Alphaproteobacteria bacterium]
MDTAKSGSDVLFILLGAIMVLAMHAGFAFLELGSVRKKNQVNALVKILVDFAVSTTVYFFVGYTIAYGVDFLVSAPALTGKAGAGFALHGFDLVKFFFLCTFAAAIPASNWGQNRARSAIPPEMMAG